MLYSLLKEQAIVSAFVIFNSKLKLMEKRLSNYEIARKKAKNRRRFYQHLLTYVSVITMLAIINILNNPDHFWFIYPMLGWGIGVVSDYYKTIVAPNIEDRFFNEEMAKLEVRNRHQKTTEDDYLELKDLKMDKNEKNPSWKDSDFV